MHARAGGFLVGGDTLYLVRVAANADSASLVVRQKAVKTTREQTSFSGLFLCYCVCVAFAFSLSCVVLLAGAVAVADSVTEI
jgi:hypothetical protein